MHYSPILFQQSKFRLTAQFFLMKRENGSLLPQYAHYAMHSTRTASEAQYPCMCERTRSSCGSAPCTVPFYCVCVYQIWLQRGERALASTWVQFVNKRRFGKRAGERIGSFSAYLASSLGKVQLILFASDFRKNLQFGSNRIISVILKNTLKL